MINANLNAVINILRLHIPESRTRDRGNGPKARPVVYRWTSGAGWVLVAPTSDEAMRMKAVNHKPTNRPRKTPLSRVGRRPAGGSLCKGT